MEIESVSEEIPYEYEPLAKRVLEISAAIGAIACFGAAFGDKKKPVPFLLPPVTPVYINPPPAENGSPQAQATAPIPATTCAPLPDFHCTSDEVKKVKEIFETTSTNPWYRLFWKKDHLEQLGREIDHIHPFAFLLAPPKKHIQTIFQECPLAKGSVLGGIVKGLTRDYATLTNHTPQFAQEIKKDPAEISSFIAARNWKGLVSYLFDIDLRHMG